MNNSKNIFIEKHLASLTPYATPVLPFGLVHLDANESFVCDVPDAIMQMYLAAIEKVRFNRYPDPTCSSLIDAFSKKYSLNTNTVTIGNGSDELIALIFELFLKDNATVLTTDPDFSMYSFYPNLRRANVQYYKKGYSLQIDPDELIDCMDRFDPSILIFSNPCNPTGCILSAKDVIKILRHAPCITVIDEAYMDFSSTNQSVIDQINEFDNLIVLKTASKYGYAALRLGFSIANPTLTNVLRSAKSPYNVNTISQIIGTIAYEHPSYLNHVIHQIRLANDYLYNELVKFETVLGAKFEVIKSYTNFVYVKTWKSDEIYDELKKCGIFVRKFENALRITCGNNTEQLLLLKALNTINK
ncbi:MAG: histidinol-phosphate aminotransferase family protein [Christensenellaceae bacterium]|jgi:histidinol-phosphate aminotransferase|nr:histidinol-phosphate aminotransferase family protein [Christensenellaceae bacterium]